MAANRPAIACALVAFVGAPALVAQDEGGKALTAALKSYPYQLLFESHRDGNWELYVVRADGSDARNLTNTPDIDEVNPKVSPDGKWIAFCADVGEGRTRKRDIYRMRIDGTGRTKVAADARDPFWSPDSKQLCYLPAEFRRFSFDTWATRGLRLHSIETGETVDHPNGELEHLYTPAFTNDGKWILATVHGGMGYGHAIVAIEREGRGVHPLRLRGCRTDLAPDGKTLTWGYGDFALGRAELFLEGDRPRVEYGGRIVRNSTRDGQTYHADWSPDGKFVAYSCGPRSTRGRGRGRGRRSRFRWFADMPQCPGVLAEGWDIWVADATKTNVRVRLTLDGKSNKEPEWIPVRTEGGK